MKSSSLSYRIFTALIILSQLSAFLPTPQVAAQSPISNLESPGFNTQYPIPNISTPLSLSRVQSSYIAGQTVVEFTLTNNLPATRSPEVSDSATVTDTVDILANFVITNDVNTLRGITLADTLTAGTTLLAASGDPTQSGNALTWNLPDLPPQASTTLTITLQTPAQSSGFVSLDSGAQANADQWGDPVTTSAPPAVLIPTGIDAAYTLPTVDANARDADMLWKSTEFGQDALTMFAYVQSLGYEAYEGSLRGTRGTLWGESGNSADKSSLLIAMLRAAGVPARYRHGTLDTANAQTLIGSLFPVQTGIAGSIPVGTPTSDPLNDPALLALVSDHWWVEAYLPVGWTNLDPSFADAQPGDVFATPGTNDRIAELPANIRQQVTFVLEVEQYSAFPIGGVFLSTTTPLTATYSVPELASKAVTFGHIVHTEVEGGVYSNVIHTYTPFFAVGGENNLYLGDEFQDLMTSFPLGTHFTTAEWLHVTITDPNGTVTDSFTRELKDLIGLDVRLTGGNPTLDLGDNAPFATTDDLFASWFLPNAVANLQYAKKAQTENVRAIIATSVLTENLPNDLNTPEGLAAAQAMYLQYSLTRNEQYALTGLEFAKLADATNLKIEKNLLVNLIYEQPRVIIASSQQQADGTVMQAMDLRSTEANILVAPGQAQAAAFSANWVKAVAESYYEGDAVYRLTGQPPLTVSRVFDEMMAQGIDPIWITPADINLVSLYFTDSESVAYAKQALINGKSILIPTAPVLIDGESVLGWWEVDPQTGVVNSVMENGLHLSLVEYEYLMILIDVIEILEGGAEIQESVSQLWNCIAKAVVPALQGDPGAPVNCVDGWAPPGAVLPSAPPQSDAPQSLSWRYLPAYLCPVDNCGLEQFTLAFSNLSPIPLPDMLLDYPDGLAGESLAARTLEVSDNGGGGGPTFDLSASPASGTVLPGETHTFDLSASANFDGLVDAWVYAPDGWVAVFDETTLEAQITPKPGALPGDYILSIVGQARDDPDVFDILETTLTVPDAGSLTLAWETEPNLTVPVGDAAFDAVSNQTNDGETEVPNSAYRLDVANLSGQSKTLTLSVSGAPSEWIVLNGARQTTTNFVLGPNERAQVGLYVSPPTLPAPGTSFNLDIQVSDGQGNSESDTIAWAMPNQPFNFVTLQPSTIYLGSDSSTDFTISMTNVGNADGTFPISALLPPITATISNLQSPISLQIGETQSFNATLNTTGIPLGSKFPIVLGSPAPGSYTQYAVVDAQIISPITEPVFIASDNAANTCTLGEPGLSAALESLALAMVHLEASCLNGDCNLSLRDQAVNAAYSVALYAGAVSPNLISLDVLVSAADDLASHTTNPEILNDLQAISDAVVALDSEVCAWSAHKPDLQWTPYYGAALVSQPTTYTLDLTNLGTLPTTYALTVTLPSGVQTFNPTVNPGETSSFEFPVSSGTLGLFDLDAVAVVEGQDTILSYSNAKLNVVDKFVQLTAVTPDPPFVETGVSSTDISISVANNANILQPATAHLEILHPTGTISYTADLPVTILVGSPRTYDLGTVDTSGWETGVYTVSVELLGSGNALIPDGAGYGYLGVGQTVGISHAVEPVIVAPGAVTVTTVITTEILIQGIISNTVSNEPIVVSSEESTNQQLPIPNYELPITNTQYPIPNIQSLSPITRTEDTDPAVVYAGTWTVVTNLNAVRASNNDYTWADANGETATLTFTGTWLHIGFVTASDMGQAEIFVDGVSQGIVDTFTRDPSVLSVIFDGFADTSHTLQIVVLGANHPNSTGNQVRLDFIDTWDGTGYTDGLVEQDNPRVWRSGDTVDVVDANASGGSYMQDGGHNSSSAWFPFTGDSVTFVGLANDDGFRTGVTIDGVWQENLWMYNSTSISRTISIDGLGSGPHVMRISNTFGEPNVDAFITPAVEPGYVPPTYTGIVRYEEDHPAILYNGYPYTYRKNSWNRETATMPSTSDFGLVRSNFLNDTIEFTFEGRWVNLGFIGRTDGGQAEVFMDGVSQGIVGTYSSNGLGAPLEFQFGNLITGTHTLSITVLAQPDPPGTGTQIRFDYIDVWDGTVMPDDFANAHKGTPSGRVHFNKSGVDATHANAIEGDYFASGLPNSNSELWYHFTGDSFSLYGLTRNNTTNVDVYVDGQFIENVSFLYPFTEQTYAVHYTGFADGPHTVRIHNVWEMRLDGFASNQPPTPYQPFAEWWDDTPAGSSGAFGTPAGMLMGIATGDLDGDGLTEIVAPSDTFTTGGFINSIFIFRGDGGDTGDGDPIIHRIDFAAQGIGIGRENIGSVALADLDGQPGAEIIVGSERGMYAFYGNGVTYWFTDTFQGSANSTVTTPAVGNLDLDEEPEIVVNMENSLVVYNADGSIAWSQTYGDEVGMPVLADMNGDGILDIITYDLSGNVRLYDFNFGAPQLLWQIMLSTALSIVRGGPAVADVDGDGLPDIAISHDGYHTVLDADGNVIWSTQLDPGSAGGVSIADIDGDGEIEIVTGMMYNDGIGVGRLYALNADGTILWEVPAYDDTSANSQSVLDLNGDGIYEIAWNGAQYGFTIFNGADGAILFSEPLAESLTATDYPIFADVDNDGYAEIVVPSNGGIVVFGQDGVWGASRPVWNQHSYHITNINDDLSVPFSEPNSWDIHNTYRTQTTNPNPLPSYAIALTHTIGLDGVTVLTNTFNIPPTTSNDPLYGWDYVVTWENTVVTQTFTSLVTNLQPGESRMVAQGTTADYTSPGGANHLELPPLFVSVPHIIALDPVTQTVGGGGSATFDVVLTNPGGVSTLYTLTANGFPQGWGTLPGTVPVPANSSVTVQLTVDVPLGSDAASLPFLVSVTTDQGGADQAGGELLVAGPMVLLDITPENQIVTTGDEATFTLALTNLEPVARTYNLSSEGLAGVILPAQVTVGANGTVNVSFTAQAVSEGANPFTITALEENGAASGQDTASVIGEGFMQVSVTIVPGTAPTGPGVLTPFDVLITNLGTVPDAYDLSASIPAGWEAALTLFGQPVDSMQVAPGVGNGVTIQLLLTPASDATPGDYDFSVTAQSLVSDSGNGVAQVGNLGVSVALSGPTQISGSGAWQVEVTNNGAAADTYDLTVFGPFAQFAQLNPTSVTLAPGASQTVQLTASGFDFFLATDYLLGVHARSQTQGYVQDEDTMSVSILPVEGVQVDWQPNNQTINGITFASFTLIVTNTGNVQTTFQLSTSAPAGVDIQLPATTLPVPAFSSAVILVVVEAPGNGTYPIIATVSSGSTQASDIAMLVVEGIQPPSMQIYLPLIKKQ